MVFRLFTEHMYRTQTFPYPEKNHSNISDDFTKKFWDIYNWYNLKFTGSRETSTI